MTKVMLRKFFLGVIFSLLSCPDEIIIINDGSTDSSKEYLEKLKLADHRFKIIHHEKNQGLSAGRNTAIRHAKGDIIAFTDDDCIVTPQWFAELQGPFANGSIVCAYGQVFYRSANYHGYFPERIVQNKGPRWPMGANIAYRRSAFKQVGLFDTKFFKYNNEDSEMAFRLARVGKFAAISSAIVYHQEMQWNCGSLLRSARNASVWPVLYKKYGKHIFQQQFYPPIRLRHVVNARDYLYIITLPLFLPILLMRYLLHGKRNLKMFFCKWPIYLFTRRAFIWFEAIRNGVFMI